MTADSLSKICFVPSKFSVLRFTTEQTWSYPLGRHRIQIIVANRSGKVMSLMERQITV